MKIDLEAEALADEFNRLMSTSKYKGKDVFVTTAEVNMLSMGGRDAEMNFGIGKIAYSNLYLRNDNMLYMPTKRLTMRINGNAGDAGDLSSFPQNCLQLD